MSYSFDPQKGLIVVAARIQGPAGSAILRLALDTGATSTTVGVGMLVAVGLDPAMEPERLQVTTGSGVEFVPRVKLVKIVALGEERTGFDVLAHTLPSSARVDGVLGLDFLRGGTLLIDFRSGQVSLA